MDNNLMNTLIDRTETDKNVNQQLINDLKYTFKINNSIPTHTPKKFVDCFWVRDNSGTKELYIYVGGSWEKII